MDILNAIWIGLIQGIIFYPLVLSLSLSYRLLKFPDISIEGAFALGSATFGVTLISTNSYILAIACAVLSSFSSGALTASLHHYLRINKFLSGIIVVTALYSVIIRILGGSNISLLNTNIDIPNYYPYFLLASLSLTCIVYGFYRSKLGIKIRGSALNPSLSNGLGYKTGLLLLIGIAFNSSLSAISGICFSLDAGFADLKIGQGTLIIALAALTIGERIIPRNMFSIVTYVILSSLIGSIFYQILWAIALQLNIQASDLKLLSAIIVVILFAIKKTNDSGDEL